MKGLRIAVFCSLAMALSTAPLNAQSFAGIVGGNGAVEVFRDASWIPASIPGTLAAGEKLRTGHGSFATLELASGAVAALGANAEVEVRDNRLFVASGTVRVLATRMIEIGTVGIRLNGAEFPLEMEITQPDGLEPQVTVSSGAVRAGGVVLRAATDLDFRMLTKGKRLDGKARR